METQDKLLALSAAADYDVCGYCGTTRPEPSPLRFIHRAVLPGGGTVNLLKVLLTNFCVNDCIYCVNQIRRDVPRSAFKPEELARLFMELYGKRLVSGIRKSASETMGNMIDTVEILRRRYCFSGHIHLKIMPGAEASAVEAGCKLASRVSVNIEAPTRQHLSRLTSKKDLYHDILERMRWVRELMTKEEGLLPSGQTTQFVVGAARETDRDIIRTTRTLYREMALRRVYFSAFTPVAPDSTDIPPAPPIREHHLYQVDWLTRIYGFSLEEVELALDGGGNLPLGGDPKLAIALKQPWLFPMDINRAEYHELIRVPGVGPVGAKRILKARREHSIDSLAQLGKMRILTGVAAPFIWFRGIRGEIKEGRQTSFLQAVG
ncbi:MAG: radical SAM protein [Chloroflexota bacterium]